MILTAKQKAAWELRRQGLSDAQIAAALGLEARESANRLVRRAQSRVQQFLLACPGAPCGALGVSLS